MHPAVIAGLNDLFHAHANLARAVRKGIEWSWNWGRGGHFPFLGASRFNRELNVHSALPHHAHAEMTSRVSREIPDH